MTRDERTLFHGLILSVVLTFVFGAYALGKRSGRTAAARAAVPQGAAPIGPGSLEVNGRRIQGPIFEQLAEGHPVAWYLVETGNPIPHLAVRRSPEGDLRP